MKFVVSLTKDIFPQLATRATLSVIDNFERKFRIGGAGTKDLRAEKRFTSFISNEDMDNIIINIKTRENSDLINNGVTETIKHEIKKREGGLLSALLAFIASSLIAPMASSWIGNVVGKGFSERVKKRVRKITRGWISSVSNTIIIFIANWKRTHESRKKIHENMKNI